MSRTPNYQDAPSSRSGTNATGDPSSGPDSTADAASVASQGNSQRYAQTVALIAEKWTGSHYRGLSSFLKGPSRHATGFAFVSLRTFVQGRCEDRVFNDTDEYVQIQQFAYPLNERAQVVLLRGFQTPQWVASLGAAFSVDPEYWRRHLDFAQSQYPDHYELPPLPSASPTIGHVRIRSICCRSSTLSTADLKRQRVQELDITKKYHTGLLMKAIAGESIVRRYSAHTDSCFSIEQNISFYLKKGRENGWRLFLWSDGGRPLDETAGPNPWSPSQPKQVHVSFRRVPIVQHSWREHFRTSGVANAETDATGSGMSKDGISEFSEGLIRSLDAKTTAVDPLYAVKLIIRYAAASEKQFLNYLRSVCHIPEEKIQRREEEVAATLRHTKRILDDRVLYLEGLITWLKQFQTPEATRGKSTNVNVEDDTISSISSDLEHLLNFARSLSSQALDEMQIVMNGYMLEESRESIDQAKATKRLSKLAFFFLPATLVTSFFGMNFREFGQGPLSIWVAFVLLPAVIFLTILIYWGDKVRWRRK